MLELTSRQPPPFSSAGLSVLGAHYKHPGACLGPTEQRSVLWLLQMGRLSGNSYHHHLWVFFFSVFFFFLFPCKKDLRAEDGSGILPGISKYGVAIFLVSAMSILRAALRWGVLPAKQSVRSS